MVPAWNEENRLPPTLAELRRYIDDRDLEAEVIVVDDGSSDGTSALVEGLAAGDARFRLLRHEANQGKGAAVATGMLAARGEFVLFTDADLSTPIDDAEPMLDALHSGADVAIGSRALDRSLIEVHQPWYRDRMGRIFNLFVQALLLPGVKDTQCGFKAFRRAAARELFSSTHSSGFEFDCEVLYRARRRGLVIREIPVRWRNSPDTRVSPVRDSISMFIALFKIRRRVR